MTKRDFRNLLNLVPDPCKYCGNKKITTVTKSLTGKQETEITCHCLNYLKAYKLKHEIICSAIMNREPSFYSVLKQIKEYEEQAPD